MELKKDFFVNNIEDWKDFYFFYVLTGDNYVRPLIKYFPYMPDGTNVVVLTNTPKLLNDVKPENFNLIVDDLEKHRPEWSRKYERVLDIQDETAYMMEYKRLYTEETYRYPSAIFRYAMSWAIEHNVTKFMVIDIGCKIGFPGYEQITKNGFDLLTKKFKEGHNLMITNIWGPTGDSPTDPLKHAILSKDSQLHELFKKYVPNFDINTYPEKMPVLQSGEEDGIKEYVCMTSDGFGYGFYVHDINIIKTALDFWNDYVKTGYEVGYIRPGGTYYVEFEAIFAYLATLLCRYYNTTLSSYFGIVTHFYQPENDWVINKAPAFFPKLGSIGTPTDANNREEFLKANKDEIEAIYGREVANIIIDGFDKI